MMRLKVLYILCSLIMFSSCQTDGVYLRETPLGASETRKAIVSVIGDPRETSDNGREMLSRYQNKNGSFDDGTKVLKERRYTHVTILGDRRPYDILVQVVVEKKLKENGRFERVGSDDGLAQEMSEKIKKALNQSLEKRNIIDDFRAF